MKQARQSLHGAAATFGVAPIAAKYDVIHKTGST